MKTLEENKTKNVFKDKFYLACMAAGIAFGLAVNVYPAFGRAVWNAAGVGLVLLLGVGILAGFIAVVAIIGRR